VNPDLLAPVGERAYDAATRALASAVGGSDEADARRVVNAAAPWVQRDLVGKMLDPRPFTVTRGIAATAHVLVTVVLFTLAVRTHGVALPALALAGLTAHLYHVIIAWRCGQYARGGALGILNRARR
jgi:hypothetical protein